MALVTCPECGREKVSDSAVACPDCGFGIREYYAHRNERQQLAEKAKKSEKHAQSAVQELEDDIKKHQEKREKILAQRQAEQKTKADEKPKRVVSNTGTTNNSSTNSYSVILGLVSIIIIVILLVSCGSWFNESRRRDQEEYRRTLESGQEKYYNGEKMTEEEYNAVKDFNSWKSKQGEHSYDEWDN